MTSTYSPDLRLELMGTGDQTGTWGATTNTNLGTLLEQAICGVLSVAEGDATLTLTASNGASDQARNMVVNLTGAMTAGRNVVVPTANKLYLVKNSTTGGFAATVKTSGGTGVAVPAGTARWVYCDATNVVDGQSGPWTPSTNDGAALGLLGTAWSDLFGATGFTFNLNNDWIATHSAGILTVGTGDLRVTTAGTNAASVVTVGGTQTLTNKSFSTINIGAATGTSLQLSGLTASSAVATDASKNLVSVTNTGSGSNVLATSPTLVTPILGTPTSGTLTNATGLPILTGVSGLGTGVATFLATPSSANLVSAVTDETGSGALVFATSPTLVTPALGTPASGVMTNVTGTAASLTAGQATAALGLKSATTTVSVSSATAPSAGQVLTATSSTAADWETPASSGAALPASSTYPLNTVAYLYKNVAGTTTDGSTLAGSSLLSGISAGSGTWGAGGTAQTGTWTNRSGSGMAQTYVGLWVRTA